MNEMNKMNETEKEIYVAPRMEVIAIEPEGVLCSSGPMSGQGDDWGGSWGDDF